MGSAKREVFGNTEILVMPIEDDREFSYEGEDEGGLVYTSAGSKTAEKMQCVIRAIAEGISEELEKIKKALRPSTVEMEVSLGFSEQSNAWIIGVKGEQKVSLKIVWNCELRRNSNNVDEPRS